jgi:hypothetical protein
MRLAVRKEMKDMTETRESTARSGKAHDGALLISFRAAVSVLSVNNAGGAALAVTSNFLSSYFPIETMLTIP